MTEVRRLVLFTSVGTAVCELSSALNQRAYNVSLRNIRNFIGIDNFFFISFPYRHLRFVTKTVHFLSVSSSFFQKYVKRSEMLSTWITRIPFTQIWYRRQFVRTHMHVRRKTCTSCLRNGPGIQGNTRGPDCETLSHAVVYILFKTQQTAPLANAPVTVDNLSWSSFFNQMVLDSSFFQLVVDN